MATKLKSNHFKSEFYNLYENEIGSDVILLVGPPGCQERIPAHTWVLVTGSDYFKAEFCGPMANHCTTKEFKYPEDDVNGFNNLIRWLYQNKCDLQSLQSSLDTLQIAIKYFCPDLALKCVSQITKQLEVKNVLKVIQSIQWYSNYSPTVTDDDDRNDEVTMPTAPVWEDSSESNKSSNSDDFVDPTICCQQLFNECLEIIDKNVAHVLNSEHFVNSNENLVRMVLKRPTLKVSSEMDVFRALYRWSTAVCKRELLPLTLDSRRTVLGTLIFEARLLTLSIQEIEASKGDLSLLLNDHEYNYIICCVRLGSTAPSGNYTIPSTLVENLTILSTPRNSSICDKKKLQSKTKKKFGFKKRFNKKELILDLVTILALIFD